MIKYKRDNWKSVKLGERRIDDDLPTDTVVYLVALIKNGTSKIELVYIGSSKNLYGRIYNHNIVTALRKNLKDHIIEIWYKDFGGRYKNYYNEMRLMMELKPIFNRQWRMREADDDIIGFWKQNGIKSLKPRSRRLKPISIKDSLDKNRRYNVV